MLNVKDKRKLKAGKDKIEYIQNVGKTRKSNVFISNGNGISIRRIIESKL